MEQLAAGRRRCKAKRQRWTTVREEGKSEREGRWMMWRGQGERRKARKKRDIVESNTLSLHCIPVLFWHDPSPSLRTTQLYSQCLATPPPPPPQLPSHPPPPPTAQKAHTRTQTFSTPPPHLPYCLLLVFSLSESSRVVDLQLAQSILKSGMAGGHLAEEGEGCSHGNQLYQ